MVQVSEAGSGYTWAVNSRLNQLTAWSNDPGRRSARRMVVVAGLQDTRHLVGHAQCVVCTGQAPPWRTNRV
ncbi:MAG: hypothetical protein IPG23_28700 [Burkholderiales bacterium]|nr:hypothetical protein [Burkholderiales bacterium]